MLVEDAALGGVVGALGGLGSQILALRKSEPTLEEVFVELVGRGFDEEEADADRTDSGPADDRLEVVPTGGHEAEHEPGEPGRRRSHDRPRVVGRPSAGPREAAEWSRRRILSNDLRSVVGRAFPRVRGMAREPSWLFFEIALPFLTTSAFVFVYRALQSPPEYIGFVVLGGAMTAFWLNVVWMMAAQLYWEKDQGNLELYFAAPMNVMAVLFGMAVGGLFMSATRAVVVLVVASLVYGVQFSVDQWGLLVLVFFLTLAALYGLGMVMASLFLMWGREAWHLTQLMTEPVYFVSGLNFPVAALGRLGALALATIPLATGLDAMRQLAFAGTDPQPPPFLSPEAEAVILAVMTVFFVLLARWMLRTLEQRARREGRLTVRWR